MDGGAWQATESQRVEHNLSMHTSPKDLEQEGHGKYSCYSKSPPYKQVLLLAHFPKSKQVSLGTRLTQSAT